MSSTLEDQNRALLEGLKTTSANLQWQQTRCNELTGAIEELVRRNIVKVSMLEALLRGILTANGGPFTISADDLKANAGKQLKLDHGPDGSAISFAS